ncbi:transposase [Streptomyces flaveolus]|uniref:transposase n=1 Tax=Streptomyces flaveolus TaxID=67297 RepID=UPI003404E90D
MCCTRTSSGSTCPRSWGSVRASRAGADCGTGTRLGSVSGCTRSWSPTERGTEARLVPLRSRLLALQSVKRGSHTGPSPVDLGRAGSKHHLITDEHDTPLAVILTSGNRNDITQLLPLLDASHPPAAGRSAPAAS